MLRPHVGLERPAAGHFALSVDAAAFREHTKDVLEIAALSPHRSKFTVSVRNSENPSCRLPHVSLESSAHFVLI